MLHIYLLIYIIHSAYHIMTFLLLIYRGRIQKLLSIKYLYGNIPDLTSLNNNKIGDLQFFRLGIYIVIYVYVY